MSPVYFHLLLNHVAILGVVFSFVILAVGSLISQRILIRTALIGFVFSALIAIPVFLTGEPAEEAVEDFPGITRELIHSHEDAADFSIWIVEILGLLSLVTLFAAERYQRTLMTILMIFAFLSAVSLTYTGLQGGQIRHSEIRDNSSNDPIFPMEDDDH